MSVLNKNNLAAIAAAFTFVAGCEDKPAPAPTVTITCHKYSHGYKYEGDVVEAFGTGPAHSITLEGIGRNAVGHTSNSTDFSFGTYDYCDVSAEGRNMIYACDMQGGAGLIKSFEIANQDLRATVTTPSAATGEEAVSEPIRLAKGMTCNFIQSTQ